MPLNKVSSSKVAGGFMRLVISDGELESSIKNFGADRLLVIYFYLPWCGSCQKMNPSVDALAAKYSHVMFLQVNAEKCPATTKKHHIYKVPLFLVLNNRVKVDRIEGASPNELELKIRRNLSDIQNQKHGGMTMIPTPAQIIAQPLKMMDISSYLNKSQCRCINDLTPTPFQAFLEGRKLVSGKGVGRLILVYAFKEKMVITALKIRAPVYSGPKVMRFFVNLSKVLDFAVVSQMSSTQEIILTDDYLGGDHAFDLKSGGLVGVENLQIYIPENQTKNRKTEIESLTLIGAPMSLTTFANMDSSALATTSFSVVANSIEKTASVVHPPKEQTRTNNIVPTTTTVNAKDVKAESSKRKIDAYAYT